MVTLSLCLIWQIISFILTPNELIWLCIRLNFASLSEPEIDRRSRFWQKKAHFDLIWVFVNKQNCRIWGTENPHAYIEKPTHPKRVTVWCGFWSRSIIGPFFFENKQGEAVIVNGDRYRAILNEFLFTKIEEEDIGNIWYQQDGATCHKAEATLDVLRPVFADCIISRRADIVWPPRSCYLTPLNYYFFSLLISTHEILSMTTVLKFN